MRGSRMAWAGLLVALAIVAGLWLIARAQSDAQQRQAQEQQQNAAVMTATTVAVSTQIVNVQATRMADAATQQVPIDAQATESVATLTAYRASLDATVAAGQISAQATNTALARR